MIEPRPLGFGEVPWHADFGGGDTDTTAQQQQQPTQTHPQVADFVKGILDEAKGADWDIESWRSTGTKKLAKGKKGPYADVRQYAKDVAKDTWFGRVSDHAEAPPMRFVDMDFVLRQEHSYHEGQYTPEVVEVNRVLSWEKELHAEQGKVEGWNDVRMEIVEMFHKLPTPLNKRVFTVLVISGIRTDVPSNSQLESPTADKILRESVDVQLPVDLSSFPPSIKSRSHLDPNKVVQGVYASVERLAQVDNGAGGAKSRWSMATASDAKGVLPQWVQKKAVPDAIAKDVKFVTDYLREKYGGEGWPAGPAVVESGV